ncbi:MAG: hypothetical protein JNM93_05010 [Bacteriovoracaceae bacterium]|nr:hypothetical protein [Bacteriovoracaceae bacterium]
MKVSKLVITFILCFSFKLFGHECDVYMSPYEKILTSHQEFYKTSLYKPKAWLNKYLEHIQILNKEINNLPIGDSFETKKIAQMALKYTAAPFGPTKQAFLELTREDTLYLKQYPALMKMYKAAVFTKDLFSRLPMNLSMDLLKILSGPRTVAPFTYQQSESLASLPSEFTYGVLNTLLPIPFNIDSKLNNIFVKQYYNPNYRPNESEITLITSKNLQQVFETRKEYFKKHPVWHRIKQTNNIVAALLVLTSTGMGITYALTLDENHISYEEFKKIDTQDTVQIIIDESPFPHLALKFDDVVYSYGVSEMHSHTVYEYLGVREIHDLLKKRGYIKETENKSTKVAEKLALPHSAVVIELNLTEEEKNQLHRYIELQRGKNYNNITGINDCATMIAKALREHTSIQIPYFLDESPNLIGVYLTVQYKLGNKGVNKVYQLATEDAENKNFHTIRNTVVAMIEAKFILRNITPILGYKIWVDETTPKEEMQWWSESKLAEIKSWNKQAREELYNDRLYVNVHKYLDSFLTDTPLTEEDKQKILKYEQNLFNRLNEKKERITESLDIGIRQDIDILLSAQEKLIVIEEMKLNTKNKIDKIMERK